MNNTDRQAVYLRDRSTLTPAQRRRVAKHAGQDVAFLTRNTRRRAKRDLLRMDRTRRALIRLRFSRKAA